MTFARGVGNFFGQERLHQKAHLLFPCGSAAQKNK